MKNNKILNDNDGCSSIASHKILYLTRKNFYEKVDIIKNPSKTCQKNLRQFYGLSSSHMRSSINIKCTIIDLFRENGFLRPKLHQRL
jgi:hypothetical protein